MSDPKHPVWKLLRLAIVGGLLLGMLSLNYNQFDKRDVVTIFGVLAGLAGFDIAKDRTLNPKDSDNE